MRQLGGFIPAYSEPAGSVQPDRFVVSLIDELPEQSRAAARNLLYGVGAGI